MQKMLGKELNERIDRLRKELLGSAKMQSANITIVPINEPIKWPVKKAIIQK